VGSRLTRDRWKRTFPRNAIYIIFANGDDSSPTIEVRDAPLKKSHQRSYDKVGEKMRERVSEEKERDVGFI